MSLLQEFINYLENEVKNHSIYVWGAQGETGKTITEAWIRRREADTGGYSTRESYATAAIAFWKAQCAKGFGAVLKAFDCSGLVVNWLLNEKHLISCDTNAHGLMKTCTVINESDRKKGCWVFRLNSARTRATHIGVVVDGDYVIHAKGRKDGVVKEKFNPSYWHRCGIPKVFASEIEGNVPVEKPVEAAKTTQVFTRILKSGCRGDDVKQLKVLLAKAGFTGLTVTNGNYLSSTTKKVKEFQKAKGLKVDGIAGKLTITALGGDWKG